MNERKFSHVLDEYLDERERQKTLDYQTYTLDDVQRMKNLEDELDAMVHGVKE
jgi:hypothetical protein